jgi:Alpha-L-fucosidase
VLTTKLAAGHCLWPSALTRHTVAESPVKVDVVQQFVEACRKHGVTPGLYYLLGWDAYHQPRMSPAQYEASCTGQLTELLTGYGPILALFVDIPSDLGPHTKGVLSRLYAYMIRETRRGRPTTRPGAARSPRRAARAQEGSAFGVFGPLFGSSGFLM